MTDTTSNKKQKTPINSDEENLAITPDLKDNRIIGHKTVSVETDELRVNADELSINADELDMDNDQTDQTSANEPSKVYTKTQLNTNQLDADQLDANKINQLDTALPSNQPNKLTVFFKKYQKPLIGILLGLFIAIGVIGVFGFLGYAFVMQISDQGRAAVHSARSAYDQFKTQDLPATEESLLALSNNVESIQNTYQRLQFLSYIPFVRNYYLDGQNTLLAAQAGVSAGLQTTQAITPYADVLGFSGDEDTLDSEDATAQNRVALLLETIEYVLPTLDDIEIELQTAAQALQQIDPNRYPVSFREMPIRSQIIQAKEVIQSAQYLLENYRPIIEHLPEIAGSKGERKKYLVLFQNDNELRPTGGFLTAYSVIIIEDGVVSPEKSDDIYSLDQKFRERIPIPEALGRYLTTERYFNLRDMNISPDLATSMETFFEYYRAIPGEPDDIDGIITVDTHLLTRLVETVGPVEVPGYGTFTAELDPRCDCPQIIYALSEIITRPTPYIREDRKGILAPLMQALLARIYSAPRTFMADLFDIGLESIEGRHLQMYFLNPDHQTAAQNINAAGQLQTQTPDGDFLAIVNANLGGAKSNLFVTYSVEQTIDGPVDGKITKKVEITYRNPRKADNCNLEAGLLCLNSTLRDWTRIYLPAGSELISAQGFIDKPQQYVETYNQTNFEVIDGFFILEPMGLARIRLEYTVPYNRDKTGGMYQATLWKQGGTDPIEHLIDVNGGQELFTVAGDTVVRMPF